ncbi:DUF6445 family protein [Halobacillus sp. A1]|uniref:DUF6445 family protein n=1 Tax=Halobacillus sp. A1 TaxID=2880262 RepID=UPI0020A62E36|nr:DUF6445 family protein [Halobacillus sp. A1]MCP3033467.1 DUF6445 family protein [Halobacillus sp. A1]
MLPKDIIVIDGFYSKPDQVRNVALNTKYNTFGDEQNFPGAESEKPFYSSTIKEQFEDLIEKKIKISPEKYVFGKFRYSTKHNIAKTKVHLDHGIGWTGIVYLSKDQDSKGGMGIYKHRKLELMEAPNQEQLRSLQCDNVIEFDAKYVYPITKSKNEWELLHEIPIKYNRLILFKGCKYFHGITEQFGDSINNSRLSQNFFFHELE